MKRREPEAPTKLVIGVCAVVGARGLRWWWWCTPYAHAIHADTLTNSTRLSLSLSLSLSLHRYRVSPAARARWETVAGVTFKEYVGSSSRDYYVVYADQAGANKLKTLAAIEDVVPLPNAFKMSPEVRRGGRVGDTRHA